MSGPPSQCRARPDAAQKKTPVAGGFPLASATIGGKLAERYEILRGARLAEDWGGQGLALLMRQGLVAWMEATVAGAVLAEQSPQRTAIAEPAIPGSGPLAEGIFGSLQAETVCVLTSMAIGTLTQMGMGMGT